jgi:hypothetical protein
MLPNNIARIFTLGNGITEGKTLDFKIEHDGERVYFCFFGKKFNARIDFADDGVLRLTIHKVIQEHKEILIQSISIDDIGDIYTHFGAQTNPVFAWEKKFKKDNLLLKNRIKIDRGEPDGTDKR